jgi:hypothetical protein
VCAAIGRGAHRCVPRRRGAAVLAPAAGGLALGAIALAGALLAGELPAAFERPPASVDELRLGGEHPALPAVELLTAAGFGAAAWRLAVLADREDDALWRRLSVGIALGRAGARRVARRDRRLARPVHEPLAVALGDAARDAAAQVGARVTLDLDRSAVPGRSRCRCSAGATCGCG